MSERINGAGVPILGQRPPTVKYTFTETNYRNIAGQIHAQSEQMGGALPVICPGSFMTLGLVLDKLTALENRLKLIENRLPPAVE